MTFIPDSNPHELSQLVNEAKASTMRLASRMLENLPRLGKLTLVDLQSRGWRIALEVSADANGVGKVALTSVSPDGVRKVFAETADITTEKVH